MKSSTKNKKEISKQSGQSIRLRSGFTPKLNSGQAAILIIFVLGMISILIGTSLIKSGYFESLRGRTSAESAKAFYFADSGFEEAMYRIQRSNFGVPGPDTFTLNFDGGTADVSVSGSDDQRTVKSVGQYGNYIRKVEANVVNTSLMPGFENAIHAGQGGVEIRNNTIIRGQGGVDGNVYSQSFIKGAKNDYNPATGICKNSSSAIEGNAIAVGHIEKLANNDSGVCVVKDAWAEFLDNCYVNGSPRSINPISPNCPSINPAPVETEIPPIIDLPNMGVDVMKNYLSTRGDVFNGDCVADGSGNIQDCTNGTFKLGNIIITGNLIKPSNKNIQVSGPIWVEGDIIFNSLGSVKPAVEITDISQLIVTEGKIISDSNILYGSNVNAFLLFISLWDSGLDIGEICTDPAISISSNSDSVLFYSVNGCVQINANSTFYGAILGLGVMVDNNSIVEYDPALQAAIFGLTKSGGWRVTSFKEK